MSRFSQKFNVFSHAVGKAGKEKCGDALAVYESKEETLVLLAVADGVSSCPCDWLAAKTACETVVAAFTETSGGVPGRMKAAAAKANSAIRQITGSCKGMLTSLSLAVWEIGTDTVHFLNVGDSRIYVGTESNLEQITVDDAMSVLVKIGGEILLDAGMPVFRRGVFRSLGQNEPLTFEVQTHKFSSKDLLVLVTDGICKNEAFTLELKDIFERGSFSEKLEQFVKTNSEKNKDDATLVVLWRAGGDKESRAVYEECLAKGINFREKDLSGRITLEYLQSDLNRNLSQNSNEIVNKLFDYAEQFGLKFGYEFLNAFIKEVTKQGTDRKLATRLQNLIRLSRN
jgi:serine/threonine protein phosphatase PrpC